MQSNPLPWNVVHSELFLQVCMPTPLSQPFRGTTPSVRQAPTTGRPGVPQVPRGYCFKFHSGRHCSGCSWKHNCFACGGGPTLTKPVGSPPKSPVRPLDPVTRPSPHTPPSLLPTPVDPVKLAQWLQYHPSAEQVVSNFTKGCSIKALVSSPPPLPRNHKSALRNPGLVSEKIQKELAAGRLAGPFLVPPFPKFIVSPLGLVPKKDGGQRLFMTLATLMGTPSTAR